MSLLLPKLPEVLSLAYGLLQEDGVKQRRSKRSEDAETLSSHGKNSGIAERAAPRSTCSKLRCDTQKKDKRDGIRTTGHVKTDSKQN